MNRLTGAVERSTRPHMLYMDKLTRDLIIERHKFFIDNAYLRLISQFSNLELEFEDFRTSEMNRLSALGFGGECGEDIPELANENAATQYWMLQDLKHQTIFMLTAAIFHQWDKELRGFISKELGYTVDKMTAEKIAWKSNFPDVFDLLKQFGWAVEEFEFYKLLDELREVVNVYKHGDGTSFEKLKNCRPQYFLKYFQDMTLSETNAWQDRLTYKDLIISLEQFEKFHLAIAEFWKKFPERLTFPTT